MIRLLLETATDICSVAVARGEVILAEHTATEAFQHSSHLTLFIKQILNEAGLKPADLDEVVLSDGPGSYTSLRVGAATAKGLCFALPGLRLRTVSALAALNLVASKEGPVLATLNSRKKEVFARLFVNGASRLSAGPADAARSRVRGNDEGERLLGPHNLQLSIEDWTTPYRELVGTELITVVGPGQYRVQEFLAQNEEGFTFAAPAHCSATHLLAPATAPNLAREEDLATYEPFYLNPPFVTKSKKKLLG
ncbi:tRNA (adenosine(37)-N6)-threonylcarbamoyltransferase complex dimerization subunit type 1 TsaB [Neolewinella antarctica]|uniref:tRNA threonylcarbamoyladenosine biosynthesis protein TsaB n=1 Tax=Neolewinella antarctica TaxID=442734 RepID=A0ABX0XF98_9BACT|nr:tRNA (adenosine(37)-N6)-threonylcarbamoyltransferase complex dimerization subunit type 1 TsaB [Neolewinella antarctica]NJC27800.1 tRNA threonylcarbamoyladenosine biosynthesis protein TsaB [Neolewinella antarctica]